MNIEYRPISKSFDIGRFFQNKTQKQKFCTKVSPLKSTLIKISKPDILKALNCQQFPQMTLKKVQMNFRITSRHESFSQSSKEQKKIGRQQKQVVQQTKNPQKLFFLDQEQEEFGEDNQINTNDFLVQSQNFITLNLKTLTLNEQVQKNPMDLFRNKIVKQKLKQRLKTQQVCQLKQTDSSTESSLVYSTLVRKRLSQRKGQLAKTELRRILNQKQIGKKQTSKKQKPTFKISTGKQKKQGSYSFTIAKLE